MTTIINNASTTTKPVELEYKPFFAGGIMITKFLNPDKNIKIPSTYNNEPVRAIMVENEKQWESVQKIEIYAGCDITYETLEIIAKKGIEFIFHGTEKEYARLFPTPVTPEFIKEWGFGYTKDEVKTLKRQIKVYFK